MTARLTPAQRLELIERAYLKNVEIVKLLDSSRSAVTRAIKKAKIKRYPPFGYLTDDIVEAFNLDGAIKRWKEAK